MRWSKNRKVRVAGGGMYKELSKVGEEGFCKVR